MLPNLRDLEIWDASDVDCSNLTAMTALERLCVNRATPHATALVALARLTELVCEPGHDGELSHVLGALPHLSSLRTLELRYDDLVFELPGGTWLTRLRRLTLNSAAVAKTLRQHAGALAGLQELCMQRYQPGNQFDVDSITEALERATALTALSRLRLPCLPCLMDGVRGVSMANLLRAALQFQRCCPLTTVNM